MRRKRGVRTHANPLSVRYAALELCSAWTLGNDHDDHVGRYAFDPGSINTIYDVIVGQPGLDCTDHVGRRNIA